ncbi:MAG: SpoIIE family protein phosphatase [Chloroflexi bacterium]|nr:SpoIIE family protein phosphatase [Chloroflexota bacterium]
MPKEIQAAVAKVSKYAVRESGDTLEVVERPHGGLSLVLADGQGSGRAAKDLSNLVAKKAIALLADGVRDGAVARAVHDFLYHYRHGQVSATLNIVSVDLSTQSVVLSRNNPCPALVVSDGSVAALDRPSEAIGTRRRMKPVVDELPLTSNLLVVVYTDGLETAGQRTGQRMDVRAALADLLQRGQADPAAVANSLLQRAVELDQGRPNDDMSVMALAVRPWPSDDLTRRMVISFPVP